jgi:two-component system response regulator QseB
LKSGRLAGRDALGHDAAMKVLVVEDSERLRSAIVSGLAAVGVVAEGAADGADALPMLDGKHDVVVLDLTMPRLDGIGVLREIRARQLAARVLVLSARDGVTDRVQALDLGADDYLTKPFSFEELRARVFALGRRRHEQTAPVLEYRGVALDTSRRSARTAQGPLALTPKEYALIEALLRHPGHVFSRGQLFEQVYARDSDASDKVIEVLISTLRGKLTKGGVDDLVQTRRGFGYVVE